MSKAFDTARSNGQLTILEDILEADDINAYEYDNYIWYIW